MRSRTRRTRRPLGASAARLREKAWGALAVAALLLGGTTANAGAATAGAEEPLPVSVGFSPERMDVRAGEFHELFPYLEVPGPEPEPDPETGAVPPVHDGPYTLTFDATGLDGVASVDLPCGDGPVTTCSYDRMYWPDFPVAVLSLLIDPDAAAGVTGVLTVTGQGEGLAFTSRPLTVRVLAPEPQEPAYQERVLSAPPGFRAGDVFPAPLGFRNEGADGRGAILRVTGTRGLSFARAHDNCWYAEDTDGPPAGQGVEAVCVLPGVFEAGAPYELTEPFAVIARAFALHDTLAYTVVEGGAARAEEMTAGGEYRQGTGAPLTVRRAATAPAAGYADDVALVLPDSGVLALAATGDSARGGIGRTVTVEAGLRNAGPAWYSGAGGGEELALVFHAPEGSTVTGVPDSCAPVGDGVFRCVPGALAENSRRTFPFRLRIDRMVHDATGAVTLTGDLSHDAHPADDIAAVVLNAVGRP
ncbi:hypothetical protein [Streptomyces sp. NPDC056600]|uniref:hypothetical protein n=1 Tax=Streptomyces sp. NPDC056600 TaxID=3345874 RepID=UPI003675EE74